MTDRIKRMGRRILRKPKVAVVTIVKDEEQRLPRMLRSLRGEDIDEVLLIDTGSTDNTVRIAKKWGCVVVPGTWVEDFSEARNQAFVIARERGIAWAFIIDADEIVERYKNGMSVGRLARQVRAESAYMVPIRNYQSWPIVVGGPHRGRSWSWQWRLVRMAALPYWHDAIHNKLASQLAQWHDRKLEFVINHDGYILPKPQMDAKIAKRLPQVQGILKEDGKSAPMLYHEATFLSRAGRLGDAEKVYEESKKEFAKHDEYTMAMMGFEAMAAMKRQNWDKAIQMFYKQTCRNPYYFDADYHLAFTYLLMGPEYYGRVRRYLDSHEKKVVDFWKDPRVWKVTQDLLTVDANPLGRWMLNEAEEGRPPDIARQVMPVGEMPWDA